MGRRTYEFTMTTADGRTDVERVRLPRSADPEAHRAARETWHAAGEPDHHVTVERVKRGRR
jgi:hypothetical protein